MSKSIEQLFEEFLFECEFIRKNKPKTLKEYRATFKLFLKLQPGLSLQTINETSFYNFFRILSDRQRIVGKSIQKSAIQKSTVATYCYKLRPFFHWLVSNSHITDNPLSRIKIPSPKYENKRFLNKNEIEKLIAAIHLSAGNNILILKRNLLIFHILFFCGLRREELLQLQIRDIDLANRLLTVRNETTKTGLSRSIPMHSQLLMLLNDYIKQRRGNLSPHLLLSNKNAGRFTSHGLKHLEAKLKASSGVSFSVHQLRHTFAVNFLNTNNNIAKLKQLLGHSSITTTLIYLRCLPPKEMRKDIENLSIDSFV